MFDGQAQGWEPFVTRRHGNHFADTISREAREQYEALISEMPYIGGDENPMTRQLLLAATNLAFYKAMKARGKTARETGKIVYDALVKRFSQHPVSPARALTPEEIHDNHERATRSQDRRYPGDWVSEFFVGDGVEFDYGWDTLECGVQKLYHAHGADEFLPYVCFLDFVIIPRRGWGFARTMTLAEGYEKCDFRYQVGGGAEREWPPPFPEEAD